MNQTRMSLADIVGKIHGCVRGLDRETARLMALLPALSNELEESALRKSLETVRRDSRQMEVWAQRLVGTLEAMIGAREETSDD